MPHTLRAVDRDNEVLSALKMLSGFDDDIAKDCTRTINRLRRILFPTNQNSLRETHFSYLHRMDIQNLKFIQGMIMERSCTFHGDNNIQLSKFNKRP